MSRLLAALIVPFLLPSPVGGVPDPAGPAAQASAVRSSTVMDLGSTAVGSAVGSAGGPVRGPVPVGRGVWPLVPRPPVTRGFDPPRTTYGRGHRGVDLLGRVGEPVHATLAGTITFAGPLAGRGVVVVDHGFGRTTYEPVAASVAVGQHVGRGQVIGTLTAGHSHCAPRTCLHWGLIRGSTYLDPLVLVGGVPVRLLPLS